jgi:DNA-binding transcriptional MerR regulator
MDKSPEAFRTISEVADALDVPPHVLRFWETRFTQVKPVKRGGGRRYYRPEDVRLLRGIRGLLYDDGMTIKGVQKILREKGVRHVIGLGTQPEADGIESDVAAPAATAPEPKPVADREAPRQPRAATASNGASRPKPQPDLFGTAEVLTAPVAQEAAEAAEAASGKPIDKTALKSLLGELQALRDVMTAGRKP